MSFKWNSIPNYFFKPVYKKIWARTGNWIDYRRDVIIFNVLFFTLLSVLVSAVLYYAQGVITNCYIAIVQAVFVSICMYLLAKGKDLWVKNAVIFLVNVSFFCSASLIGRQIPLYINFIPIITCTLFFYNTSQIKNTVFMLALTFTSLIVLEYTNYSLLQNGTVVELSASQIKIHTILSLIIGLSLGGIMIKELITMNMYNQRKLKRVNLKLKKQNDSFKKINSELDSFAYRSSHDLRSPLTSIMGIINVIQLETDIDKIQEYMVFQERSVKKLEGLVQDILDISRNSRLEIQSELIMLNAFLQECLEGLSYVEEYGKVKVSIDVPELLFCYSDRNRLKVVFTNILSNGFRYYDQSKEVSFISVSVDAIEKDTITLLFKDNGTGIKIGHMSRIFDMFYRGTDRNNGSGLGLYIVKESIEKIGGRVSMSSVYGQGTSVLVSIANMNHRDH